MKYLLNIKNNIDAQLSVVIILFFISEALTKISLYLDHDFHNYSALVKGGFSFLVIIYAFFRITDKRRRILFLMLIMGIMFGLGQYIFNDYSFGPNIFQNTKFFFRYLFVFTILLYFSELPYGYSKGIYLNVFEKIILFNSLLILLGFLFDIQVFKTYKFARFGYSGLFAVPSIATYFYALSLTYFGNKYITHRTHLFVFIFIALVSVLTGTKALFLFLFLTIIHLFIKEKYYNKKGFIIGTPILILILVIFRKEVLLLVQKYYAVLYDVYREHDLVTMLTSYRNLKLQENFLPLIKDKWHFVNYIFGGTDFVKYRIEFELFDLMLFFGIVGSIIYLFFYFTSVVRFGKLASFGRIQMLFFLIIGMLSGTFFHSAPTALYLLVVLSSLTFNKHKWQ